MAVEYNEAVEEFRHHASVVAKYVDGRFGEEPDDPFRFLLARYLRLLNTMLAESPHLQVMNEAALASQLEQAVSGSSNLTGQGGSRR